MARLRNRSTIPQGMLAPAGLDETVVNPNVQATTRPAGTLLRPSPGFDTVRVGKNRFQGKGPTGGFRPMEFAEDVGGTGAALSVIPGDTGQASVTEWLPDETMDNPVVIADRQLQPGWARWLHEASGVMPDMGDRTKERPLSKQWWSKLNPTSVLRQEYQTSPALAVAMGGGLVYVVYLLASEVERQVGGRRGGRGLGSEAASVPAGTARAAGDVTGDAVDKVGEAADKAVESIEAATEKAVNAIESAAEKVTD